MINKYVSLKHYRITCGQAVLITVLYRTWIHEGRSIEKKNTLITIINKYISLKHYIITCAQAVLITVFMQNMDLMNSGQLKKRL